ncbi:DegT/DnrJ/EryC1/StrS aminotransferase family protein [Puniceicoccaceae bacterium K14]|nr:DegT/DnrJ/EryC1/StrS aminotransferase family protein [Puniceicoccaceae bacterium K14]
MLNTSFSPWPSFTEEEAESIRKVLLSNKVNYWTGTECREFEKEFASWAGSSHAIALGNGTLALDACLAALNISSGDEVIVTSRTFIASVSAIVNAGAIPVFADIDINSQNVTATTIAPHLSSKTKAIICVHLAGWPCEMEPILKLAQENKLFVIEDCAQAHGAKYKNKSVGSFGHTSAWSFCQDKIMSTAGEGGMVTTNDSSIFEKTWSLKDHGKSYRAVYNKQHPPGFRWLHESFGHNWRMTEIQGAIGRIQLSRMQEWHKARTKNALAILNIAGEIDLFRVPKIPAHITHAWYKCYTFVNKSLLKPGWNRDRIINEINALGVPCYSGSCSEVYLEKAFKKMGIQPKQRLQVAGELGETSLMFLVHPTLTKSEIERTCATISKIAKAAQR